jgi:hypothetical protein
VEMAEGVDKAFYPDYANVKITCWFDHPSKDLDLDWNVITQHTNDVIKVKLDENGNGIWDTGNYKEKRQAEKVYYYPYDIELRAFWDVEEVWNVDELPILEQKPKELIKKKQ